jgi:hypothetical protein
MQRIHKIAPGVGLALVVSAMAATVIQGCAPGKICDKPEYEAQCAMPTGGTGGGGTGGSGGGGSGGSGGGGAGGNRDGGGTDAGGPNVSASTALADCTEYNTLGKMDEFFGKRCGHETGCHTMAGATVWSDLKMANVFSRFANTSTKGTCIGQTENKMLDMADWQKSMILVKTRDAMPKCKNGTAAGTIMPAPEAMQAASMKQPPLTDAEKKCIENFVRVATGH